MAKKRAKVPRWNPLNVTNTAHVHINVPDKMLAEDTVDLLLEDGERFVTE